MNLIDYRSYTHNLSSEIKAWKKFRPERDQKSALSMKHYMVNDFFIDFKLNILLLFAWQVGQTIILFFLTWDQRWAVKNKILQARFFPGGTTM